MTSLTKFNFTKSEQGVQRDYKREGGNFRDDGYVQYLDCGNGFMSIFMYQNIKLHTLIMCSLL